MLNSDATATPRTARRVAGSSIPASGLSRRLVWPLWPAGAGRPPGRIERVPSGVPLFGHASAPTSPIERIDIGIENDVVEMPDHDGETGKDGLVVMDCQRHVQRPTGQELGDGEFEPNHQAGGAHDDGAPEYGPILQLLWIAETSEFGSGRTEAGQIPRVDGHVFQVLGSWEEVPDELSSIPGGQDINEVISAQQEQHDTGPAMGPTAKRLAGTEQDCQPGIGKLQREAGDGEDDETESEGKVLNAL